MGPACGEDSIQFWGAKTLSNDKIDKLIQGMERREKRALARAISVVENKEEGMEELLIYAYRNMNDHALIVGMTGPGGAGKSTTVDRLIQEFRARGKTVGVMAVDPSSPYTGGAFLGDRIRMGNHNVDHGVFIRSFGSRGCMGGISEGTKHALYLFKNYDFDVILIESLGIGQDETEITNFVDVTVVTVVPGYGDQVQIAKAGMQEIADIFVVNKADKPDAMEFYHQMAAQLLHIPEEIRPIILTTIATEGTGIPELADTIVQVGEKQLDKRPVKASSRVRSEIETITLEGVRRRLKGSIDHLVEPVLDRQMTPFDASQRLLRGIQTDESI